MIEFVLGKFQILTRFETIQGSNGGQTGVQRVKTCTHLAKNSEIWFAQQKCPENGAF